ncbi:unnamed protein product [Menidia menidia]|uniref:(Atlantic silverside) hypothetical protein n=1 Tax=Menidia menidia TaxID=238744 RepID=A0A8S4BTJ3_9TELE|nr:unnamed protein product [Menidia menidia]
MEFELEPIKLTMGEVVTPFHCMKFDMATEKQRLEQMDSLVKETCDMEVGLKRTRSGRIIKSTTETNVTLKSKQSATVKDKMVSQYDVLSSQESLASSTANKKRKFSEPKEHY